MEALVVFDVDVDISLSAFNLVIFSHCLRISFYFKTPKQVIFLTWQIHSYLLHTEESINQP